MKILFITSEVDGIVKTGGLADVAYALPKELQAMGHDVRIIMPAYRVTHDKWHNWPSTTVSSQINHYQSFTVEAHTGEHDNLPIIAVEHPESFDRDGIYDDGRNAFYDNPYRFAILSKAALQWCKDEEWQPDIIQANDWQSALACFYLSEHYKADPFFENTRSAIAIHNGAYQMQCQTHWLHALGIDRRFYNSNDFEDIGHVNLLKGGLSFADGISTVSPGYASELVTRLGGHGIDFKFREAKQPFMGILNGCDYDQWNPETDTWIAQHFSTPSEEGKAACKLALQAEVGLTQDADVPLLSTICRLVDQKGIDMLIPVFWNLMQYHDDCQVVVLGSGDAGMAAQLEEISRQYPTRFYFMNGYNVGLSHRIEAGADAFLMPSVFEPCGLNQIYSLRYGTLPLVREVGGLKDTVNRLNNDRSNVDSATGFMFLDLSWEALLAETLRLLDVYRNNRELWTTMQSNAMAQRFTWDKSAAIYLDFYQTLLSKPKVSHPLVQ